MIGMWQILTYDITYQAALTKQNELSLILGDSKKHQQWRCIKHSQPMLWLNNSTITYAALAICNILHNLRANMNPAFRRTWRNHWVSRIDVHKQNAGLVLNLSIYIYHSISIWLDLGLTHIFLSLVLGETMSTQCRRPNNNLTGPWLGMVNKQPIKMVMLGDCLWPWVYHIVHFRTQFFVLPNQRGKRRRGPGHKRRGTRAWPALCAWPRRSTFVTGVFQEAKWSSSEDHVVKHLQIHYKWVVRTRQNWRFIIGFTVNYWSHICQKSTGSKPPKMCAGNRLRAQDWLLHNKKHVSNHHKKSPPDTC